MRGKKQTMILLLVALFALPALAAAGATRVADAIWAHGELYDTVVTPTSFVAPPEHSTDTIYNFAMSGLSGQRSVADAAPGDPTFNGGRWSVQIPVFTAQGLAALDADHDGFIDLELTSGDQVLYQESQGNIEINPANFYFECPMLPRRGR